MLGDDDAFALEFEDSIPDVLTIFGDDGLVLSDGSLYPLSSFAFPLKGK